MYDVSSIIGQQEPPLTENGISPEPNLEILLQSIFEESLYYVDLNIF